MKIKHSMAERVFQIFNYAFLTLLMAICIYPIWYVLMASVSDSNKLMAHTGLLLLR